MPYIFGVGVHIKWVHFEQLVQTLSTQQWSRPRPSPEFHVLVYREEFLLQLVQFYAWYAYHIYRDSNPNRHPVLNHLFYLCNIE